MIQPIVKCESKQILEPENTNLRVSMIDLLFDRFGFDQTSKTVVNSTKAKQLNPDKNRRSVVQ